MMEQQYLNHQMGQNNSNPNNEFTHFPKFDNVLFVADLPEETSEEDLENFFKNYNFLFAKLIRNVFRVHAFVSFHTRESAEKARYELNGAKITAKYSANKIAKPVRLCRYEIKNSQVENQRDPAYNLLIKNIPKEMSQHNLWRLFRDFGDIRSCKLAIDYLGNNKGFGFVNFYRSEDAEKAKRELNGMENQGKMLKVANLEYGRRVEKKKNNIYVKNLPLDDYSNEHLEKLFEKFGEIKSAVVIRDINNRSKGFGFVCFENPESAQEAHSKMRDQNIFEGCSPLYVNFAMKKSERLEILHKKKEEMYRNSQKMTIFAKIKDENAIKDENDFKQKIRNYVKLAVGPTYEPKSIKIRFESKNAFITMNHQRDAEEFIKKIQELSKKNSISEIFFSLYKSKVDRINSNANYKKYNDIMSNAPVNQNVGSSNYKSFNNFNNPTPPTSQGSRYKSYNQDFTAPQPKVSNFNAPKSYNNFDNVPNQMMESRVIHNNFNYNQQMIQINQPLKPKNQPPQELTKDDMGDFIFNICERIYPEHAPKITGMIIELPEEQLRFLTSKENVNNLEELIHNAYSQCNESGNN